jgi:hypothetical protein
MNLLDVASTVNLGSPNVSVSFIGQKNIMVENDFVNRDNVNRICQQLILSALENTYPGQLEVAIFDDSLSGIISPFSELSGGVNPLVSNLNSVAELEEYLDFLKLHILGVQNVLQGKYPNLSIFRQAINKQIENYKLVVICVDFEEFLKNETLRAKLQRLVYAGPQAGVNFLFSGPINEFPVGWEETCDKVPPNLAGVNISADQIIRAVKNIKTDFEKSKLEALAFTDVQDLEQLWNRQSANGLTFSIGKFGLNNVDITLGNEKDQRHNALITGAVGQGKSNLLQIIIHSLCQNYSPQELELYLLDYKEGVTLQNFSNINHEDYLPHAKVLGLESDIEFGLATLEHLNQVYEERMRLFKEVGVQNIQEYRESVLAKLPRIVLIIDEFQMMFWDRSNASTIANTLEKCARLFRAAGIHIILASQSIRSDELSGSPIFAQIPIRIAHKNSISESEATLTFGNIAPTDLRLGQAIVNLDYGVISANRKVQVALADEAVLAPMRQRWWKRAKDQFPPPYVFDINKSPDLTSALTREPNLLTLSDQAVVGEKIAIDQSIAQVSLTSESGRNAALVGLGARNQTNSGAESSENIALGIIQSMTLALALQNPQPSVRFIFFNGLNENSPDQIAFHLYHETLKKIGVTVEIFDAEKFQNLLNDWSDLFNPLFQKTYLVGLLFDKIVDMPPNFPRLIKEGPLNGVHIVGWWQKAERFETQIGFGGIGYFDIKILLRAEERDIQHLLGVFDMSFETNDNRAIVFDSAFFEKPLKIIPYKTIDQDFRPEILTRLKGEKP